MRIGVIGAGVIGVTTAWRLAEQGHEVTLYDRESETARHASFANGAQLSYSYVAPLADPSVPRKLPVWLLDPRSPLSFVPRLDPDQWRWGIEFLRRCTRAAATQATADLLALSYHSRDVLNSLLAQSDDLRTGFNHARNGKLVLYRNAQAFDAAQRQVALQAALGSSQQTLHARACVDLEPALNPLEPHIAGGIFTGSEEVGDCAAFTRLLLTFAMQRYSVQSRLGTDVRSIRTERGQLVALVTSEGEERLDACVIAAGNDASRFVSQLGIRMAVYPLQGYSLSVPVQADQKNLGVSITDLHHKTVYAPLGQQLRVAGLVDMVGRRFAPSQRRGARLLAVARETFPHVGDYRRASLWCGARPATPGSLPIISSTPVGGVWINGGHGALGFTLAAGSASLVADLITGDLPMIDPRPYSL